MFHTLHIRIKNMARWESSTVKVLGLVEIVIGIALLIPVAIALLYNEDTAPFVYLIPVLLALGLPQYILFKRGDILRPASGLFMIFMAWWIAFIVSAIPFYIYGLSAVDSFFEAVSGFTTTGISMMAGDPAVPHSIVFWGAFTQWAGGIAIIMLFLSMIPMMGIGGKAFLNNELAGFESYNFSMRIRGAVSNFIVIYVLLSALEVFLLVICGVTPFESVTMMFSTISTGGFMASGSMADYSFAAQAVVLAFMFLGGTNFYLHYRALNKREFSAYRTNQEFIWAIIWVLAATVAIVVILISSGSISADDLGSTLWGTLFSVVSFGTTTGYTLMDQSFWPIAAHIVFWVVMLSGFMSGSTSGGIKIYRLLIIKSYITNGIYKMFHPLAVRDVRMNGQSVSSDAIVSAVVVVMMFVAAVIISVIFLLVSEPGMSVSESAGLSISAISNSGVHTGTTMFPDLNDATKIFLAIMMWVGRLEVILAVMLFTRTFWTDLIKDARGNRAKRKRA